MDERKNPEGYADPTAFLALANIESEKRVSEVVKIIKHIVRLAGFELVERIQLYDPKTGKFYR